MTSTRIPRSGPPPLQEKGIFKRTRREIPFLAPFFCSFFFFFSLFSFFTPPFFFLFFLCHRARSARRKVSGPQARCKTERKANAPKTWDLPSLHESCLQQCISQSSGKLANMTGSDMRSLPRANEHQSGGPKSGLRRSAKRDGGRILGRSDMNATTPVYTKHIVLPEEQRRRRNGYIKLAQKQTVWHD